MKSNTDTHDLLPAKFYLGQNYPNPFSATTTIKFCLAYKTRVILEVFDSEGMMIQQLLDDEKDPGTYKADFDASHLSEGVYIYQLQVGDFLSKKKMTVLRQGYMSINGQRNRR
jgi:hypothetical protein